MRTLKFDVNGQIIDKNPTCDFEDIVPGTKGYLQASFSFTEEWKDTIRVAEFVCGNRECEAQLLEDGTTCIIPAEALRGREFKIRVLGKRGKDFIIVTNRVTVRQNGGVDR